MSKMQHSALLLGTSMRCLSMGWADTVLGDPLLNNFQRRDVATLDSRTSTSPTSPLLPKVTKNWFASIWKIFNFCVKCHGDLYLNSRIEVLQNIFWKSMQGCRKEVNEIFQWIEKTFLSTSGSGRCSCDHFSVQNPTTKCYSISSLPIFLPRIWILL